MASAKTEIDSVLDPKGKENRLRLSRANVQGYAWAVATCFATALVVTPLLGLFDLVNIVMLFLLSVVLVAVRLGRGPAVVAAFLSVLLFDVFFVPPRFSFAVSDAQYLITFAVMLAVALVIGQLAGRLHQETDAALIRERRTRALYEMTRSLCGAINSTQVAEIIAQFVGQNVAASAILLLPDRAGELIAICAPGQAATILPAQARIAYERGNPEVFVTVREAFPLGLCLPLKTPMRVRGVLMVTFREPVTGQAPEHRQLLDTIASLASIVIERIHYVEVAQEALINVESERLKNSLLSSLSHDLRTPLTVLVGMADTLMRAKPPLPMRHYEATVAVREHTLRMSSLVHNLLDMARLQTGKVKLRKEWQLLEEVIGSSLKALELPLARHCITTRLPDDLPLLEFDAVLIERVLVNLLENAIKYAPDGDILIEAHRTDDFVEVAVADNGPGLPSGAEETLFSLFERGQNEASISGVGLGLSICRAIVEFHGGHIRAMANPGGGARFVFSLPVGIPPAIDEALMERLADEAP
jgi:two-component system, OmpR family, sensor histidine kinase KdpD